MCQKHNVNAQNNNKTKNTFKLTWIFPIFPCFPHKDNHSWASSDLLERQTMALNLFILLGGTIWTSNSIDSQAYGGLFLWEKKKKKRLTLYLLIIDSSS